jgi:hypothetical protein
VILTTSRGLLALALSPVVILLASAARLLIIANYDTTTATTMAASGGLGQTILGTVIPLLPSFLPALLVVLVILRQWALFGFAALAAALISPAYATLSQGWHQAYPLFRATADHAWNKHFFALWHDSRLLVYCAVAGAAISLWDNAWRGKLTPIRAIIVGGMCALALLLTQHIYRVNYNLATISESLRRPWLPAEVTEVKSGAPRVGYILSTDRDWHTVLDDSTRTISYVRTSDVTNRTVCQAGTPPPEVPAPLIHLTPVEVTRIRGCSSVLLSLGYLPDNFESLWYVRGLIPVGKPFR